jgi:hypothetical protein
MALSHALQGRTPIDSLVRQSFPLVLLHLGEFFSIISKKHMIGHSASLLEYRPLCRLFSAASQLSPLKLTQNLALAQSVILFSDF